MQRRTPKRLLALALALVMVLGLLPGRTLAAPAAGDDGSAVMNESLASRENLVPIGPSFSVKTLLQWTPESDPDAMYSRSVIPLAQRHGGFVVNPLANPEAKLQLCAMPNSSHDTASAQGNENFFSYCFNYWQYADSFIYWTGSEEGIIACPTGEFVDAAHVNGVPVVATLGFPWGGGTGYVQQVSDFCQKAADGTFPVADKLIEVMEYYGFDGYFFNQESYGCSAEIATRLNEMIHYMHKLRPDMLISWYDSMTASGGVNYQDAVTDANKLWMEYDDEGTMGVNEFMMNYNWYDGDIATTIATMRSIGRSEFDAFAGFNVQANVYGDRLRDHLLVDEDGLAKISLSLYYNNQTITLAKDGEDFHRTELEYYVNSVADPRKNPVDLNSSEWAGMSRFFADKTVILDAPFVTDFNTGHGHGWFVEGEKLRDTDWSYQSVQDVLPTWTWIIDSEGSKLSAGYDFTTAWNGGSSLRFSGTLDAANTVMLYSAKVPVEEALTLKTVSMGTGGKVLLWLGDENTESYEGCEVVEFDLSAATGWAETSVDLSAHAGKTIYAMGLRLTGEGEYTFRLGRLALLDRERNAPAAPGGLTLDDILYTDAFHAEARIFWDQVSGASSYQVAKVEADGSRTVILETPNNALYIPTLLRSADEEDVTLEVRALNRNGEQGEAAELTIDWLYGNDDSELAKLEPAINVALNADVTGFSEQGDGAECRLALDGISSNGSKWWASGAGDWMSIDLGTERTIRRIRVLHAEAGGEGKDFNTNTFTVYYKDAAGAWVQAYKVSGNTDAITDDVLDTPITAREWKLEINRIGPSAWSAVNIYEWEMYETGYPKTEAVPMQFASAHNAVGAEDRFTLTHVPVGHTVKVYGGENLLAEAVAESSAVTIEDLNFGPEAGRLFYTTTQPGYMESPRMSTGYDMEDAPVTETPTEFHVEVFSQDGSNSSSRLEGIYVSVTAEGLHEGDVLRLEDGTASLPVAAGETAATIRRIWVPRQGGALTFRVKGAGMALSEAHTLELQDYAAPSAKIHLYAYNSDGESLTGVRFAIVDAQGREVAQLGTTSDSGGMAEAPLGTYTIRCTEVPEGYAVCEDLTKILAIEGWTYELKVILANGTTEPEPDTELEQLVAAAEAAEAAAAEAARLAEEAVAAAEAAAASAAEDRTAAEKAQREAEEALAAAEEAAAAAEAARAAVEAKNLAAAKAALAAAEAAQSAAQAAAEAAEAQRLAQEARLAAEEAAAAAEAAAAEVAEERSAAEAAQRAAEEAASAAAEAAAAADASSLAAAEEAAAAARSAALAAQSAAAAQAAQADAEEAARVAEAAAAAAEEAQRVAEEAAATAGPESEAATDALRQAEAAAEAAAEALAAAEEAAAAAKTAAEAAKASELAAAEAAASAAEYARLAAEAYAEIVAMKAQIIDSVNEAILAAEAAKRAELALAKTYALVRLSEAEGSDCVCHQADMDALIAAATAAVEAAETPAEVDAIAAEALEALDAIRSRKCAATTFRDVAQNSWFHEGVDYVLNAGYMNGVSAKTFAPDEELNRSQMVTILYRAAGEPGVAGLSHPFIDVPDAAYYHDALLWAYNAGIVNGVSAKLFGANEAVSRAQLATFLHRFAGTPEAEGAHLSAFVDEKQVYDYAREAMNWAVEQGILNGIPTGSGTALRCADTATRAQIAAILMRWLG